MVLISEKLIKKARYDSDYQLYIDCIGFATF